jgi:SAM-dependent methyltransferase
MTRPEPLVELIAAMRAELDAGATVLVRRVLDPDHGRGCYPGELVERGGATYVHRPLRVWVDLAERLGLRLATPRPVDDTLIELRFERLPGEAPWRAGGDDDATERYGAGSGFARIHKHEDPGFVIDLGEALARVPLGAAPRVLDLGVNRGDELALMQALAEPLRAPGARFVGVDHSASALAVARARFAADQVELHAADLAALPSLDLGRFDLVVSIGTLHSPGIDDRAVLRHVVQELLAPDGSVIIGLPNCRYRDGEIEYGTRVKNLREPELGVLMKDVAFYRKYLQQHRRRVYVTGKHDVLVTAVPQPAAVAAEAPAARVE